MSSQRNQTDSAVLIDEMSPLDILAVRPIATGSGGPAAPAAVTAILCGFDAANRPLIANVGGAASEAIVARTVVPLTAAALGSAVVVLFDGGDSRHPIIIGVMQPQADARNEPPTPTVSIVVDDQRVLVTADRQLELRCGEAKIILTSAGKVLIQGTYVSTRSSGVNRIKGGSVQIN